MCMLVPFLILALVTESTHFYNGNPVGTCSAHRLLQKGLASVASPIAWAPVSQAMYKPPSLQSLHGRAAASGSLLLHPVERDLHISWDPYSPGLLFTRE